MLVKVSKSVGKRKPQTARPLGVERLESRFVLSATIGSTAPILDSGGIFQASLVESQSVSTDPQTIDIGENSLRPFTGDSRVGTINLGTTPTALSPQTGRNSIVDSVVEDDVFGYGYGYGFGYSATDALGDGLLVRSFDR